MEFNNSIGELLGFEYVSIAGGTDAQINYELYKQELEDEDLKIETQIKEKKEAQT